MYCDAHVEFIHHPADEVGLDLTFVKNQISPSLINKVQPELLFLAVYVEPSKQAWSKQLYIITRYLKVIRDNGWVHVKSKSDLERPGIKVILHIEDLYAIGSDLEKIQQLFELGIRSIGLTHNHQNQFAGGSLASGGLTPLGFKAIRCLANLGMILDFAHLSESAVVDVVKTFPLAVFVSHTGIRTIFPNPRNVSNRTLRLVKETHGFIGIGLAGSFLGKSSASRADFLKHLHYASIIAGADKVGIGSDLGGVISFLPDGLASIADVATSRDVLPKYVFGENLLKFIKNYSGLRAV